MGTHGHHRDRSAAAAIFANGTYFLDNPRNSDPTRLICMKYDTFRISVQKFLIPLKWSRERSSGLLYTHIALFTEWAVSLSQPPSNLEGRGLAILVGFPLLHLCQRGPASSCATATLSQHKGEPYKILKIRKEIDTKWE